jgi:hypothetical protein
MIELLPSPPDEVRGPLESVLEQAIAGGAEPPPWVAVEDASGRWLRLAAAAAPTDRARSVVAVAGEQALVDAARLGIGGAMWLPPSTGGARDALAAAAREGRSGWQWDPSLVDLVPAVDGELAMVCWADRGFWLCQLGEQAMARELARLAEELGALPAVLPGPVLVLPASAASELDQAWQRILAADEVSTEGLAVIRFSAEPGHCGVAAAAMKALADPDAAVEFSPSPGAPFPVHELPSGSLLGAWMPPGSEAGFDKGWCARPAESTEVGFSWRLEGFEAEEHRMVEDVTASRQLAAPASRLPGWLAASVGAGRPAGLLAERLATAAARLQLPLWIPNVDQTALHLLLRLEGRFWVDGPAVPRH